MSQSDNKWQKIAVIGAGQGLGNTLLTSIEKDQPLAKILAIADTQPKVTQLSQRVSWLKSDLSVGPEQESALNQLHEFSPDLVICALSRDSNHDVSWNLIVAALFPTRLWRWALTESNLKQVVVVAPDGGGKQGLSALLRTLTDDKPAIDLRLFSPPTTLDQADARQVTNWSSEEVAKDLIVWLKHGPRYDHRRLAVNTPAR